MENENQLSEITSLIIISNYISSTIYGNYNLETKTINALSKLLVNVNRKIHKKLLSDKFNEYITDSDDE